MTCLYNKASVVCYQLLLARTFCACHGLRDAEDAEQLPQEAEHQLHVAVCDVFSTDRQVLDAVVLLQEHDREVTVLDHVHARGRILAVLLFERCTDQLLNEGNQQLPVAKILIELLYA